MTRTRTAAEVVDAARERALAGFDCVYVSRSELHRLLASAYACFEEDGDCFYATACNLRVVRL